MRGSGDTHLKSSQEGSEDIDLHRLLPHRLSLTNTLLEMRQQLLTMLVGNTRKRLPKQQDRRIDHGHPQGEGVRNIGPLGVGHIYRGGVMLQCPRARSRVVLELFLDILVVGFLQPRAQEDAVVPMTHGAEQGGGGACEVVRQRELCHQLLQQGTETA